MTNPTDWLLWNLRGRPRISIPKELFTKVIVEEGLPVLDSVPTYKYSEYMAGLNRRAWRLLELRAFKPVSAARQKAVIAAGRQRLEKTAGAGGRPPHEGSRRSRVRNRPARWRHRDEVKTDRDDELANRGAQNRARRSSR